MGKNKFHGATLNGVQNMYHNQSAMLEQVNLKVEVEETEASVESKSEVKVKYSKHGRKIIHNPRLTHVVAGSSDYGHIKGRNITVEVERNTTKIEANRIANRIEARTGKEYRKDPKLAEEISIKITLQGWRIEGNRKK